MKANNLITSINSLLNEDKFAKYTIQQIYDELGEEEFLSYIEALCHKTVRNDNLEYLIGMKINKTLTADVNNGTNIGFCFYKKQKYGVEILYIYLNLDHMRIRIVSRIDGDVNGKSRGRRSESVEIEGDRIKVSDKIRDGIIEIYNHLNFIRKFKLESN